ncbi:CTTNBP2 N-terminal-like protein isoform X1 [Microplitis mediator]|uniref:CTTNBP2 N-terminal-like protein isoform X1 n=1 Tax=Microplitis mediator TaxID=375433 RepID=UPI0025577A20|nr:CTTNBP2 N-terminal-like protein isoform X1 [Microplitis mediator]XP_057341741.1 CTTNBP2 N-terminal-like protein isoform X1 [Microplitis mediator]XP_057341742.1 CTTNBP2 N-terminal-like protein isoform X1 [Microplitis mediator]
MSGDYDTKSIIRSSGKSLSVVSNIKVRVSSRRELSPSPCAKKRRKYNCESCKSFNEDNMASQNSNSPGIGNLTSSLSTAGSSIAAPVSSQLPSSSLSVSTSLSTPSSSTSTSPSQSPSPSPMLSPSSISSMSQGLQQTAPHPQQKSNNFEPLDKSSSNTLKRNPKMELSKTDLLKLLGYLEGELQARDIVIAALKSEKMKHLLSSRYRSGTADPHAALARDVAIVGGVIRMENNQTDRQVASLEALVTQQRRMQCRMAKVLKEAEIRHRTVIKELEEEKRKHEHDTAQGDDITYGLEKERTRLKKELELERQEKKRLEMELKKENIALEVEKSRQKQIVLLLLAERKKIIMKYIEERKRSEDLAQILSEEKVRIDSMAEGLEEESKKSLQMEAEVEKQQAQFDMERQQYRQALAKAEKRNKELEADLEGLKTEVESWKNGATMRSVRTPLGVTPPPPPAKPANLAAIPTLRPSGSAAQSLKGSAVLGTGTPMVSSKVVQPTATVSSVPVSGPTTGIARSVTPRQVMRGVTYGAAVPATPITNVTTGTSNVSLANTNVTTISSVCTTTTVTTAPTNINATTAPPIPGGVESTASEPQTTDKRTLTSAVPVLTSSSSSSSPSPSPSSTTALSSPGAGQLTGTKKPLIPRGIPPPVPPNKPVVPPKKEAAAYMRRPDPNSIQETLKITKSPAGPCQPPIPASSLIQPASVSPIPSHQIEETKPR